MEEGSGFPSSQPSSSLDPGSGPVSEEVDNSSQEEEVLVAPPVVDDGRMVEVQQLMGTPFPSITSLPLSSSFKFFLNNVTLSGVDWVEGLRKLSLSPPLPCSSSPLSILPATPSEGLPLTLDPDPIVFEDDPYLSPP